MKSLLRYAIGAVVFAALAIWALVLPALHKLVALWGKAGGDWVGPGLQLVAGSIAVLVSLIPIGLALFALYDQWTMWRYRTSPGYREKLAAQWGEALATIIAVDKTPTGYAIRFRYQDRMGTPHEVTEKVMDDEYRGWKPGQGLKVAYKTASPEKASIDL